MVCAWMLLVALLPTYQPTIKGRSTGLSTGERTGRGEVPRPVVAYAEALTATLDLVSAGTAEPLRTTLSAPVLAALPNTS
jgi:hypothetical protein